jgi:hypothetical protein
MKSLFIGLILMVLLAFPAQISTIQAAREEESTWEQVVSQSEGGGTTVYLPLISNSLGTSTGTNTSGYRQNARYLPDPTWLMPSSVFWFGRVSSSENYVDVRTGYTDSEVVIWFEVFDRMLWYDTSPTAAELTQYDAISLYLRPSGVSGSTPDAGTYRFVAQSHPDYVSGAFQAEYTGNGSQWVLTDLPYNLLVGYEGEGGYNQTGTNNMGWILRFRIPYTSLGLSGKPADGTAWAMAITLHDRDGASTVLPDQSWPPSMDASQPATWAELGFGLPTYTAPTAQNIKSITIRQGLNAATVPDASVGGSTICGDITKPSFFNTWGDLPESAYSVYTVYNTQVNIQNQANVADWPCFAKYYVTFPLDAVPAGKVIQSAKLVMYLFGNSDPNLADSSLIHVMTVSQDWDESTLTWNNAPLVAENFAATYVEPLSGYGGDQGVAQEWTISAAVARAYQANVPLRLVLYSSDWPKHSGKYFYSSEYSIASARPTLIITYGDPAQ